VRVVLVSLLLLALVRPVAAERIITDSAGREVTVPDQTLRVFAPARLPGSAAVSASSP